MRIQFALIVLISVFATIVYGGAYFGDTVGAIFGVCLTMALVGYNIRWFLVSVPEITGLVTVNFFDGTLKPYGTGIHFRYPWEQVKEGNYINLRIVTQEFGKDGQSVETYPSSDGPEMLVKWSFQYQATITGLPQYIAVDETTINNGLREIGSSFLSGKISEFNAEDLRKTDRSKLEQALIDHFEKKKHRMRLGGEVRDGTLEELYGIDLIVVSLSDIDFSKLYQQARETKRVTGELKKAAEDLRLVTVKKPDGATVTLTDEGMSHGDAFNNVLVVQGRATKTINVVEGKGAQAGLAALQSIFAGKR